MQASTIGKQKYGLGKLWGIFGGVLFVYLFLGFMVIPCFNTLTSVFRETDAAGNPDPFAVIRFFFAGNMPLFLWNSIRLAVCLVVTVNVVGISIVLLTEYFDIKGAKILRLGYMTTLIYSGVALVTGYQFLYDPNGLMTKWISDFFPGMNKQWFTGFNAVLFTMTFACTSNHALFLRNAIRGIDYNTVEAARNLGAKPFKVLLKVVMPTLLPTLFSLTVMTFITGLCAMSAPTLLGYNSINPEIVRLAGSSVADEAFPQARAALLSVILAMCTITLLLVLNHYESKGHYLSVSKTKAKLVKQKIQNPVANVLAHIYMSSARRSSFPALRSRLCVQTEISSSVCVPGTGTGGTSRKDRPVASGMESRRNRTPFGPETVRRNRSGAKARSECPGGIMTCRAVSSGQSQIT